MKIYTSEIAQFGKELKILNELVKFDSTGSAEVEDKLGEQIIAYSSWYSKEKLKPIVPIKAKTVEDKADDFWKEALQIEIEKLKKQDESRVAKIKSLIQEGEDVRADMQKVVDEKAELETELNNKSEIWTKEKEQLEYKFQLALLEIDELKEMCSKLGLKEEDYSKKHKKEPLIELIINAAK